MIATRRSGAGLIAGAAAAALASGALIAHGSPAVLLALAALAFLLWAIARPEHAALVLLLLTPFSIYPLTVGGFSVFAVAPLVGLTSVILLLRHRGTVARLRGRLPMLAGALLVAVATVTAALSTQPTTALSRVLYLVIFGLFAAALASAISAGAVSDRTVAEAVVAAAAAAAIALIVQVVAQFSAGASAVTNWLIGELPLFAGAHAASELGQLNWTVGGLNIVRGIFPFMDAPGAGQFMMLGLLAAVWLRLDSRPSASWLGGRLGLVAIGLIATGLLMTFSRQSWVGAFVGFGALALRRRPGSLLLAVIALFVVMTVVPAPGGHETFADYLLSASNTSTTSTATRLGLWQQAFQLVPHHWVIGVGPGLYATLNPDPANPIYYAHNVYLDELVELGALGTAALIGLLAAALKSAFRRRAMLGFAMLAAWATANLFDDSFYEPRVLMLLATAFALAAAGDGAMKSVGGASSRPLGAPSAPDGGALRVPRGERVRV